MFTFEHENFTGGIKQAFYIVLMIPLVPILLCESLLTAITEGMMFVIDKVTDNREMLKLALCCLILPLAALTGITIIINDLYELAVKELTGVTNSEYEES